MSISKQPFGVTREGQPVELYTLESASGVQAQIMTYGGTLVSLQTRDRSGRLAEITLGFDTLEPYLGAHPYLGALIGRFANRIAGASFTLDGKTYTLPVNDPPNSLHGGTAGFDRRVWSAEPGTQNGAPALQLTYSSPDGEEGYPGNLQATAAYSLTDDGALRIEYGAVTDQATVVNLTNHAYFNLAGTGDILGHQIQVFADHFLPVNTNVIPTGVVQPVAGTVMDLRALTELRDRVQSGDPQLMLVGGGYDHNFALNPPGADGPLRHAAHLAEPVTGRTLDVMTSQPGIQVYTGNMLNGGVTGRGGWRYTKHTGLCLETQHFPDAPNQPAFASTVLRPGEMLHQVTIYRPGVSD